MIAPVAALASVAEALAASVAAVEALAKQIIMMKLVSMVEVS
jgi:hypothetical protein